MGSPAGSGVQRGHRLRARGTAEPWVSTAKRGSSAPRRRFRPLGPPPSAIPTHSPLGKQTPFIPKPPPALPPSRTQPAGVRSYSSGDLVPSATHENNIPLYTVTRTLIPEPLGMDSLSTDELHLQQCYFSARSPVASPAQLH